MIQIKDKGGRVLKEIDDAYLAGAYLAGAYLVGANLVGADLGGAYLAGADLAGADLRHANLRGANLRSAYLVGAYLRGADLRDIKMGWTSHSLISEILWRAADEDIGRQMFAAFVGRKYGWCWKEWGAFDRPEKAWAVGVLTEYVREDDIGVPDIIMQAYKREGR